MNDYFRLFALFKFRKYYLDQSKIRKSLINRNLGDIYYYKRDICLEKLVMNLIDL